MDAKTVAKVSSGVIAGVAAYVGGSKVATSVLHAVPGLGTLAAVGINSSLNAYYTYRLGAALSEIMDNPNLDLSDAKVLAKSLLSLMLPPAKHALAHAR